MELLCLPMVRDDVHAVLHLWSQTEGVGLNESDTPDPLRAYLDRNPGLSRVVRHAERIVAAVLCGHDGRRGYLNHLAVMPAYRRRGLARRMVTDCLESLGKLGISKCNIFLYVDNDLGARFWTGCGWSQRSDLLVLQIPTAKRV